MGELNSVEQKLKKIYDSWETGVKYENDSNYSYMFRIGFPEEYLNKDRPLLMYVGQECRNCVEYKTQNHWFRDFTALQLLGNEFEGEHILNSPFWNFARRLKDMNYDVIWNNLDKFHKANNGKINSKDSVNLNMPYGDDYKSILQREIDLLQPQVVIFAIGKNKYTKSLASAFGLQKDVLYQFEPTVTEPVHEITEQLNLKNTRAFWCYHPAYLQRKRLYCSTLKFIRENLGR